MKLLVEKLMEGKECAIQLRTLFLQEPVFSEEGQLASAKQLAAKILASYSDTLSVAASAQIAAVDCGGEELRKKTKKWAAGVKDRRGRYTRKKSSDTWVTLSSTMEDGCAWRKYGQKHIFNSIYPRCYYRCTYKSQGCAAIKQVQKMKEDPALLYKMTYFNHHTCANTAMLPQLVAESDPVDSNILISFQSINKHEPKSETINISSPLIIDESEEDIMRRRLDFACGARSSTHKPSSSWDNIIESRPFVWSSRMISDEVQDQEEASGLYSCASTSFQGLDMEVNQLDHNLNFDEIVWSSS